MGIQILLVEQDQAEREQLLSSLRDEGHLIQPIGVQPETATNPAKLLPSNRSPMNRSESAKKQASLAA